MQCTAVPDESLAEQHTRGMGFANALVGAVAVAARVLEQGPFQTAADPHRRRKSYHPESRLDIRIPADGPLYNFDDRCQTDYHQSLLGAQ